MTKKKEENNWIFWTIFNETIFFIRSILHSFNVIRHSNEYTYISFIYHRFRFWSKYNHRFYIQYGSTRMPAACLWQFYLCEELCQSPKNDLEMQSKGKFLISMLHFFLFICFVVSDPQKFISIIFRIFFFWRFLDKRNY